jgi:clan AA aspartic protease (TIGR02281 family)
MLKKIGDSCIIIGLVALTACSTAPPPISIAPLPVASPPTPSPTSIAASPSPEIPANLMAAPVADNSYQDALVAAKAAQTISGSALTKEDWTLVTNQWQDALKFLQSVPKNSPNYRQAINLLPRYQQSLSQARQKSATFREPAQKVELSLLSVENSNSFSIPIIKKLDNIPVVEVTFNGQQRFQMLLDTGASRTLLTRSMANQLQLSTSGKTTAKTANGISQFDTVELQSVQFGQGMTNNIVVSVGQDTLNYGLLGHDVYKGYDITLKEDVILFNKR